MVDCYVTGFNWLNKPLLVENLCENSMDNNDDLDYDEATTVDQGPSKAPSQKPTVAAVRMEVGLQSTSNGKVTVWVHNTTTAAQQINYTDVVGQISEVRDYCTAENALGSPMLAEFLDRAFDTTKESVDTLHVRSIKDRTADLLSVLTKQMGDLSAEQRRAIEDLILEFKDIFALSDEELTQTDLVTHSIETTDERPVTARTRQIPYALREKFALMLKDYVARGIISPSASPYASPIVLVAKKETGSIRLCADYRALNEKTIKEIYPLFHIDTTLMSLGKRKYFTSVDFLSGYWQIRMDPASKAKTAFTTPLGHFEFNVMAMGLCNAVATFQRFMNRLFDGILNVFAYSYVDDLLVASDTFEDHLDHLRQIFQRIREANLKLKASKCSIARESIPFLGHVLTREGIKMDGDKLRPIKDYPQPRNLKELQRFLGMASYYRKFVKNFATLAAPLFLLVHKDTKFKFGAEQISSFNAVMDSLCGASVLRYPDFDKAMNDPKHRFVVITDASKVGLGAVLCQPDEKRFLRPLYFASRRCNSAESRYSPTELEALGIKFAANKFAQFIVGMSVKVLTDHRALIPMFKKQSETGNPRVDRFLLELKSKFDLEVIYHPGKQNVVADALSRDLPADKLPEADNQNAAAVRRITRAPQPELLPPLDTNEQWIGHLELGDLSAVYKFLRDKEIPLDPREKQQVIDSAVHFVIEEDILYRLNKDGSYVVCVPEPYRKQLFDDWHSGECAAHRSGQSIFHALRRQFYWPRMRTECIKFANECLICAQARQPRKNQAPLEPITTTRPWELVCVDLLEIGTSRSKNRYVLVMQDHFSKWTEAEPIPNKEAETVARAIVEKWILRFGCMEQLHSDMGTDFCNSTLNEICRILGMNKSTTRGYDARANGLVERANRSILAALQKSTPSTWDWDLRTVYVTFAMNVTPHASTGYSPFEIIFGKQARFPLSGDIPERPRPEYTVDNETYLQFFNENLDRILADVREQATKERDRQKQHHDGRANVTLDKYHVGDRVMVHVPNNSNNAAHRKLSFRNFGPYEITKIERTAATVKPVGQSDSDAFDVPLERLVPVPSELGNMLVLPNMRRKPAMKKVLEQKKQQEHDGNQHKYNLRPRVRMLTSVEPHNLSGQKNAEKVWTTNDKTKTSLELIAECSIEKEEHLNCHMPTVAELDPSVDSSSSFGQMFVITPLQEALLHMLMRETGVTNAERIMTDVIQAGAGNEIVTYLGARGDIIKASVAPSEADMSKAVANRYDNCQVAKRIMKASGHRRVDFSTDMHAFVSQKEQKPWKQLFATTEGIIETTRALLVHRASKLVSKKIVILGDSSAEQLAEDLTEKELITSERMPDLIRLLTSTELMSGVQNVLVVVGRDAMLAEEKLETFEGQCQKLLGYLKGFPNVKVTWLVPPFIDAKKEFYEEWLESIATVLKDTDVDLVWSTRYRSVLEITRHGTGANFNTVDKNGMLTRNGRFRLLGYLMAVHGFPINVKQKDKKEHENRKRDSAQGDRSNGHAGQSYYGKRRRF